jgi:hypothetical protein
MQKHNWKINIVNEWTGEKRGIRYKELEMIYEA